jgi:hypothetical protein
MQSRFWYPFSATSANPIFPCIHSVQGVLYFGECADLALHVREGEVAGDTVERLRALVIRIAFGQDLTAALFNARVKLVLFGHQ